MENIFVATITVNQEISCHTVQIVTQTIMFAFILYTLENNYLDLGFNGNYHDLKFITKILPALIANSISKQCATIGQKNDGPIPRHNQDVAPDRPNHTGVTATAAATKLLNATENGKHKTPPPAGTPAHREPA